MLSDTGQSQSTTAGEKAGVEEMEFWCFDATIDWIAVPWLEYGNEEYLFQKADIALAGLVVDVDATFRIQNNSRVVQNARQAAYNSRKRSQFFDFCDVAQITRQH